MIGKRVDANQKEIVTELRKVGAEWIPMNGDPEIGFDGLIAYRNRLLVAEIKDGSKPPSERKLTAGEEKRKAQLERRGVPYNVILSIDDALRLIGVIK
jgi:hypothetical protein